MSSSKYYIMWEPTYVPKRAGFPTALESCRFPWESLGVQPWGLTASALGLARAEARVLSFSLTLLPYFSFLTYVTVEGL